MAVINIRGFIIDNDTKNVLNQFSDWGYIVPEATSPKDVKDIVDGSDPNEPIDVMINSPGGYVIAGQEIYSVLRSTKERCTVTVESQADSAAGVIAMAGNKVIMSPVGEIMIHNVAMDGEISGDYHVLEKAVGRLKNMNAAMAQAYVEKSGMPLDKVLNLMDKETWLTANQCIEYGFADEIMESTKATYTNSSGGIQAIKDFIAKATAAESKKKSEQEKQQLLDDLDSYRV
jgi:ATP-dependent protease ClpP protease subunit